MTEYIGQCLCGGVTLKIEADLSKTGACHCGMCRKQNGGGAYYGVMCDNVDFQGSETLTWFDSSDWGQRGFCNTCGTTIAWLLKTMPEQPVVSIALLENQSDVKIKHHIFTDQNGSYAPIPDNAPHHTAAEFMAAMSNQEEQ